MNKQVQKRVTGCMIKINSYIKTNKLQKKQNKQTNKPKQYNKTPSGIILQFGRVAAFSLMI